MYQKRFCGRLFSLLCSVSKQETDIIIKRTWQCCDWWWPHIAKLHQVLVSWTDTLTLFPTPPDFQYLVAPNWEILVMVRMMMPMMMILVCLCWPLLTSCTLGDDAVEQYMQIVTITQSSEWQCIYILMIKIMMMPFWPSSSVNSRLGQKKTHQLFRLVEFKNSPSWQSW